MKRKKQALTLVEMMLVMLLISVIGSAVAFNLKGAMKKGKAFKTQEMQKKIDSALSLALLEGYSPEEIESNWVEYVKASPFIDVKPHQNRILDGWGDPFEVHYDTSTDTLFSTSKHTQKHEEEWL